MGVVRRWQVYHWVCVNVCMLLQHYKDYFCDHHFLVSTSFPLSAQHYHNKYHYHLSPYLLTITSIPLFSHCYHHIFPLSFTSLLLLLILFPSILTSFPSSSSYRNHFSPPLAPHLISPCAVTSIESDGAFSSVSEGVHALQSLLEDPECGVARVRHPQLWVNVIQVPLEAVAFEFLPKFNAALYTEGEQVVIVFRYCTVYYIIIITQ